MRDTRPTNHLEVIGKTKGRIFSVDYTKKNGETRVIVCRTGVKKGVKGTGTWMYDRTKYVKVFDMHRQGFRTLILESIGNIWCGAL